ncbi:MAG: type II toxin-antitoxin system RelE/ParE family toxin [Acidobacteria bacterium]|jgi:mRNA interferase RelE/StbE|nr:type II toxin-antitoxin system RelE/ParE family toxin [Acidobacteriota bacterium]
MQIKLKKRFLKQLANLPKEVRERIEVFVFEQLPNLASIAESGKIEKMQGFDDYFKIRFGSYRVGLKLENDEIIVQIVMHRKEIYRFFP